jgi:hypothetical protein
MYDAPLRSLIRGISCLAAELDGKGIGSNVYTQNYALYCYDGEDVLVLFNILMKT